MFMCRFFTDKDGIVSPPKSYVEALTPNVTMARDPVFQK